MSEMDVMDVYRRLPDYERIARDRGVHDESEAADRIMQRLWDKLREGLPVNEQIEGLVINGLVLNALRDQQRVVPDGLTPHVPNGEMRAFGYTIEKREFEESFRRALLDVCPITYALPWALLNVNGVSQRYAAKLLGVSEPTIHDLAEHGRQILETEVAA